MGCHVRTGSTEAREITITKRDIWLPCRLCLASSTFQVGRCKEFYASVPHRTRSSKDHSPLDHVAGTEYKHQLARFIAAVGVFMSLSPDMPTHKRWSCPTRRATLTIL